MSNFKLYYTPTSCGAASYIAAHIGGVPFESEQINLQTHKTASGADFYQVNPKGNVPTVALPSGQILNEGAAVLQYIADQAPQSGLAPPLGSFERYQLMQALNFVCSEIHMNYSPLFNPTLPEDVRTFHRNKLSMRMDYLQSSYLSEGRQFMIGNGLTVADLYLYIVLSWSGHVKVQDILDAHPAVKAFYERVDNLPQVKAAKAAMSAEKSAY